MTTTLAVDVGQTSSRLVLSRADGQVERWTGAGGRAGESAEAALLDVLTEAIGSLGSSAPASIDTVSAGLTGLQGRPARAADVLEELRRRWQTSRVILADDALTSYVGALGLRRGVVVAAGTGAVTLATDGSTRHARVDGWGYLVGDLGSGYWIGRRGLEAALQAVDGRGGSPALERLATSAYGDLETLPLRLAADPDRVRLVAKFAHETATAAHSGDAIAARIWREAADHLAEAVAAACRRIGLSDEEIEVSWTGRLFCAGALLTEPFAAGVTERLPAATLRAPAGGSLDGALGLAALSRMPALHPLVTSAAAA